MSTSPITRSDSEGERFEKLGRIVTESLDNLGIGYTPTGNLVPISRADSEGERFAKLGALLTLLADNIAGGGGGTAATGVDATITTVAQLQAIPMVGVALPVVKVFANTDTFSQDMWRARLGSDATDIPGGIARANDWASSGVVWYRFG